MSAHMSAYLRTKRMLEVEQCYLVAEIKEDLDCPSGS